MIIIKIIITITILITKTLVVTAIIKNSNNKREIIGNAPQNIIAIVIEKI